MFGRQNIWSQLVIHELLFIGGCYPAVMHGPHAQRLHRDSGTWLHWLIRNCQLPSETLGTRSRSPSLCRVFHFSLIAVRGFLVHISRRGCEHFMDAFEDWWAWFPTPGTEDHLTHPIEAWRLRIHGVFHFGEIANTSVGQRHIGSTFLSKDMLEI
jgi:hypothetical protein